MLKNIDFLSDKLKLSFHIAVSSKWDIKPHSTKLALLCYNLPFKISPIGNKVVI